MFTLTGVKGDIFLYGVDSVLEPVNYDSAGIAESYIYVPHYINGLDSHITSFSETTGLRDAIIERDGACVLTGREECDCQEAHIIGHSKGDEFIRLTDFQLPNFAMECDDVPNVPNTHHVFPPGDRITAINIKEPNDSVGAPRTGMNVHFKGPNTPSTPPSPILLDYHFGMSFFKRWGDREHQEAFLTDYHSRNFDFHITHDPTRRPRTRTHTEDPGMALAAEFLMMATMRARGLTPEVLAERARQKREQESLEVREKVKGWLDSQVVGSSPGD
ncbi:hypothetical protein H0H93_010269 [Arthromyces matolae]|nr:hypothetical protein H0H93_010269 [Arthromyces matolae]